MQKPLLLLVILLNFVSCTQDEEKRSDSIHAIPLDAAIIIESNDIVNSIKELTESPFWRTLSEETSLKATQESLFIFDSTIASYSAHISSKNPVFLSLHLTGAKSFNWLMVSSTKHHKVMLMKSLDVK